MTRNEFLKILENECDLTDIDVVHGIHYSRTEIKIGQKHLHFITNGSAIFKDEVNDFLFTELCRGRYWHEEKPITPEIQTYWNSKLFASHETHSGSNMISYKDVFNDEFKTDSGDFCSVKRFQTIKSIIEASRVVAGQFLEKRKNIIG